MTLPGHDPAEDPTINVAGADAVAPAPAATPGAPDEDDDDDAAVAGPKVLAHVALAKTITRK